MAGIWDIGRPSVVVERRKIIPRERLKRAIKKRNIVEKPILGPLAQEVSAVLRFEPIRFPSDWMVSWRV